LENKVENNWPLPKLSGSSDNALSAQLTCFVMAALRRMEYWKCAAAAD